jgi:hypothetical protein
VVAGLLVPLALLGWYRQGPAKLGWAARAGTPAHLRASVRVAAGRRGGRATVLTSAPAPPGAFTARVVGTIRNEQLADGSVRVVIVLRLAGGPGGAARLDLHGQPLGGGVSMDASGVSFVPATTRATYLGTVTALQGSVVGAQVRDASGDRLSLTFALALDPSTGTARGVLRATTGGGDSG